MLQLAERRFDRLLQHVASCDAPVREVAVWILPIAASRFAYE